MIKQNFLNKLKSNKKLELVEPSEEMRASYLEKADNCLRSAKILHDNNLFENSISESYYAMYNSLTALLFKIGIKCENHAGSILLLKKLIGNFELFKIISWAKEERIDKQYYVSSEKNPAPTKDSSKEMILKSEDFIVKMKLLISKINSSDIQFFRKKFSAL